MALKGKSAPDLRFINGIPFTLPIRVWDKIRTGGEGECWQWTGHLNPRHPGKPEKYGMVWDSIKRRMVMAHRYVYERVVAAIADDMVIDHLCDNTECVNPAHLRAVTHSENIARGNAPGAVVNRTKKCLRGHDLSPDNLTNWKRPMCKKCVAIRNERKAAA